MDKYWSELQEIFSKTYKNQVTARSPLGLPALRSNRRSRAIRYYCKYLSYPNLVKRICDADVIHVLDHSFAYLLNNIKSDAFKIVTVHDLIPLRDISGLKHHQQARYRKGLSGLHQADLIIADSQCTAIDIEKFMNIDNSKVIVIPLGVNIEKYNKSNNVSLPALRGLTSRLKILSVGSLEPRKNLAILPDVLARVAAQQPDVSLIRVGSRLPDELGDKIRAVLHPGHFIELSASGMLSEDDLVVAYRSADVLFFPSLWEGYGLPVLEALAAGTPVVCSNSSSLTEVGGQAAVYFDPRSSEEAADKLLGVRTDVTRYAERVRVGLERAHQFSWKSHAEKLMQCYTSRTSNFLAKELAVG